MGLGNMDANGKGRCAFWVEYSSCLHVGAGEQEEEKGRDETPAGLAGLEHKGLDNHNLDLEKEETNDFVCSWQSRHIHAVPVEQECQA